MERLNNPGIRMLFAFMNSWDVFPTVSTLISTDTPFGIPTNPQSSKKNPITVYPTEGKGHETKLIYLEKMERKIAFIDRSKIT